ncbi:unnamed protein product [Closterium sp. NIES-53]
MRRPGTARTGRKRAWRSPYGPRAGLAQVARAASGDGGRRDDPGLGGTCAGGARAGGAGARDPGAGGARARRTDARGTGAGGTRAGDSGAGDTSVGGVGARGAGAGDTGAGGTGAGGTGAGGAGVGGTGAGDSAIGGAVAGGARAGGTGARGTVQRRPSFLQLDSPLPAPPPYAEQTDSTTERREPESRPALPVCVVRTRRRVPHPRPPPVPGTHGMALRPSSVPLQVTLPSPPVSALPDVPNPESHLVRVTRLLAIVVTHPSFESTTASALVNEPWT